jgi:methionine-rich copper-binding protein CopC
MRTIAFEGFITRIGAACAHATLDHASPPAGSTVPSAPQEVLLTFTERLESAFSMIEVSDAGGTHVDSGKSEINGSTMRVGLKVLPEGQYRVHWRAITPDAHRVEGNFTFNVDGQSR